VVEHDSVIVIDDLRLIQSTTCVAREQLSKVKATKLTQH